jgi:hypothetical protein
VVFLSDLATPYYSKKKTSALQISYRFAFFAKVLTENFANKKFQNYVTKKGVFEE